MLSREVVDWKARPTSALGPPLCALLSSSRYFVLLSTIVLVGCRADVLGRALWWACLCMRGRWFGDERLQADEVEARQERRRGRLFLGKTRMRPKKLSRPRSPIVVPSFAAVSLPSCSNVAAVVRPRLRCFAGAASGVTGQAARIEGFSWRIRSGTVCKGAPRMQGF